MMLRPMTLPLLLLSLGTGVAAAEETPPPSTREASTANWSGVYAGAHAGYGRSSTSWRFPFDEYYNVAPGDRFSIDPKGSIVGAHLLFNRQFGHVVAGVEATFANGTLREERIGAVTAFFPADRFRTDIDDIATVSGRIGYAWDQWLIYGAAGYATAQVTHHALSGPPGEGVEARIETRMDGPSVGGGLEYMVTPTIVLGVDYRFSRLGGERHATETTGTLAGQPITLDTGDVAMHAVTARFSIRLGADQSQVEALK